MIYVTNVFVLLLSSPGKRLVAVFGFIDSKILLWGTDKGNFQARETPSFKQT